MQKKAPMYERIIKKPSKSFLLLGPRGTGKSTWLRTQKFALTIDLLRTRERLTFERDPGSLDGLTEHLKAGDWVLIDEVQKVPSLLDEVHRIYEERRLNFALSGSSARKLKRAGVNLLAGRAINTRMYPLVYAEYCGERPPIEELIEWGTLPLVMDNSQYKEDTLESYIDNYLRQELIEEGIVRKIEPFSRFLQVAGQMNGQILNVENIAREAKVKRPTVDTYFEVLIDTLLGFKLPSYQPCLRINEVAHAKFYFFDGGVARAAAGLTRDPLDALYRGFLFETYCLNEVRAYNDYSGKRRDLFYYAVRTGGDIDLIIQLRKKTKNSPDCVIAIEFKCGKTWRSEWGRMLNNLDSDTTITQVLRRIVVYTGLARERHGEVELMPIDAFLGELHQGKVF